jgi:magnesium transporter
VALFIPLIGGTGGNVGTQLSAIVVQGPAISSWLINVFTALVG